jgi:GTP cyclohydrolase II
LFLGDRLLSEWTLERRRQTGAKMNTMSHQSSLSADASDIVQEEDSLIRADRAAMDLRRGRPIVLWGDDDAYVVASVENGFQQPAALVEVAAGASACLIITAERARVIGFLNGNARPQSLRLPVTDRDNWIQRVAWSVLSPGEARTMLAGSAARAAGRDLIAALDLAKACYLVPAIVAAPISKDRAIEIERQLASGRLLGVGTADIVSLPANTASTLTKVSEARVPLIDGVDSRFIVFRGADGVTEQVAIQIGTPDGNSAPMVRLHSACLTGDLFGSLRCDCGEQLRRAVQTIADNGWGVILYLAQEGRGIGLANKMRTYDLQDSGLDTIDSDSLLGFGADERRYEIAVAMLKALNFNRIRIMTNNPEKISHLEAGGLSIVERVALQGTVTEHNYRYLNAKLTRAGHLLDDVNF